MFRCLSYAIACLFLGGFALLSEPRGVWLDVPFIRQEKNGCGAAGIAMIMQYWNRERDQSGAADVETIQRALYSPGARGIYASDLERYLRRHGFRTFAMKGEWIDVKQHLQKGRPLLVALKSSRDDLHYVVVTGFDPQRDAVLKHDPAVRKLLMQHRDEFEKEWRDAGNWTLLALPNPEPEPAVVR